MPPPPPPLPSEPGPARPPADYDMAAALRDLGEGGDEDDMEVEDGEVRARGVVSGGLRVVGSGEWW